MPRGEKRLNRVKKLALRAFGCLEKRLIIYFHGGASGATRSQYVMLLLETKRRVCELIRSSFALSGNLSVKNDFSLTRKKPR